MSGKTLLILVDGMRPDGMAQAGNAYFDALRSECTYSLGARTVMPSVTLPCHMSLMHSVEPARHGITTNTYVPQMRPVTGLCEVLKAAGKKVAFFTTWEELRDIARPGSLAWHQFISLHHYEDADDMITAAALDYIGRESPDFAFVYLGNTDETGHKYGWLSPEYEAVIRNALNCIKRLINAFGGEYTVIVTADHGGHDRMHGTDMDCDMTIPLFIRGEGFANGKEFGAPVSIMDIAPTVAALLGAAPDRDWEGKDLSKVK